jgi:pyruvate/2-oxoglutarate dehydrogenase complex dihydrolipoamide dehydrogenase (E3) component
MSVALIERKLIGGTCVNTGCTPTKTLIASAFAAQMQAPLPRWWRRLSAPTW